MVVGPVLFGVLFIMRLAQMQLLGVTALGVLLAAQAFLVALLLLIRREASSEASTLKQLVAWLSAAAPFALRLEPPTGWLEYASLPGLLLILWAGWSLGRSFSIAPADRGLVTRGPYRFLRHPMYAGELLSLAGGLIGAPSTWNLAVFALFALSILWRVRIEERIVSGYATYAASVRWRLIPGVY